ncbi:TetR family transcriptional regulator C-terminal domain-containing protein [Streptomyces sp. NPDC015171]|uniref:TetR family transcriptional regulator C-terminal domain-containing protein n=1 Tax=Streptomyces sp. NPDC015171 TaxID=3364945 RepID=UPI0036FAAE9F
MGTETRVFAARADKPAITDKRLLKGARARETVLRRAVDIASLDGLDDVSFGRLATDTGMSKAGIQTLFRAKEVLQLATIDYAREMFIDAVVRPARTAPPGAERLRSLVEHWIEYARTPLFEGGCFRVANTARFDSKPGPIRDALFRNQQEWTDAIGRELRTAVAAGEIAELDIDLAVFQIDSALCAANTALRLGDEDVVEKVRRIVRNLLVEP